MQIQCVSYVNVNVNVNVNVDIYITTEGFKTMTNCHRRLTGLGRD